VLSGLDDEALALRTVELGAQDYLVKGRADQALVVRSIRYAIRRAAADRALANERKLLRDVIDNLVDAVYVKDTHGHYLLGNHAHARQLGLDSPDQVVGKETGDLFPKEVAAKFRADDEMVLRTGQPIINRHESVDDGRGPVRWLSTTKVPLRDASGRMIGIVGIGRDITARKQAEEQLARYTQELREKNAEMEDDLNLAREVQQAFLPQQFPSFPRHAPAEKSALRFCSRYLPTTTLGGDFFHVVPISDSAAGVLICDVMGHGVRAAMVTAIQRALVEELTAFAADPGEFLTQLNDALLSILRRTRSPMFASAFYLVADAAAGRMSYANAGHPRPLHIRRHAREVSLLEGPGARPGPALGVFQNSRYLTQEREIAARDLLMLFTDGLYEVENARGEYYDQALLLEAVRSKAQLDAEEIFEETLDEVRKFSASNRFVDDVCLVGVEVCRIGAASDGTAAG
jgi:phosphoserine phosphatase RsbU/P